MIKQLNDKNINFYHKLYSFYSLMIVTQNQKDILFASKDLLNDLLVVLFLLTVALKEQLFFKLILMKA